MLVDSRHAASLTYYKLTRRPAMLSGECFFMHESGLRDDR